eukprot:g10173.t1
MASTPGYHMSCIMLDHAGSQGPWLAVVASLGNKTGTPYTILAGSHGPWLAVEQDRDTTILADSQGPWLAVVAALGTRPGHDLLLDGRGGGGSSSSLMHTLRQASPHSLIIVYSHTACSNPRLAQLCKEAGADYVLHTPEDLEMLLQQRRGSNVSNGSNGNNGRTEQSLCPSCQLSASPVLPPWAGNPREVVAGDGQSGPNNNLRGNKKRRERDEGEEEGDKEEKFAKMKEQETAVTELLMKGSCIRCGCALPAGLVNGSAKSLLSPQLATVGPAGLLDAVTDMEGNGNGHGRAQEQSEWVRTWVAAYPPLARRRQRDTELTRDLGAHHLRTLGSIKVTNELTKQCLRLPSPLIQPALQRERGRAVRFVCVSDTHHHHKGLRLPEGDVLLHTGDLTGNYGEQDVDAHFESACRWLAVMATRFKHVIFIAGNHDTILDDKEYDSRRARQTMRQMLPSNVVYLEDSGLALFGLKIYGTPVVVSRVESEGRRFYSDAFERTELERKATYDKIPEGLDLLLTHQPPSGYSKEGGDHLLTQRLAAMSQPPRIHCYGHTHKSFGVYSWLASEGNDRDRERTIFLNSAQEWLYRMDPEAGGYFCGLVQNDKTNTFADGSKEMAAKRKPFRMQTNGKPGSYERKQEKWQSNPFRTQAKLESKP